MLFNTSEMELAPPPAVTDGDCTPQVLDRATLEKRKRVATQLVGHGYWTMMVVNSVRMWAGEVADVELVVSEEQDREVRHALEILDELIVGLPVLRAKLADAIGETESTGTRS